MQAVDDALGAEMLWTVSDQVPLADLPAILDGVIPPKRKDDGVHDRNNWDAGSFYSRILVRAWSAPGAVDAGRALNWLRVRQSFSDIHSGIRADDLRAAMKEAPKRVRAIASHFSRTLAADNNPWLALAQFREAILFEISIDEILDLILEHLEAEAPGSEKELCLYEVCFGVTYSASPAHSETVFEKLYAVPDGRTDLLKIRGRSLSTNLSDGYFNRHSRPPSQRGQNVEALRMDFEKYAEQIRSGAHLGWLSHIAKIYFALYDDIDLAVSPRERLVAALGESNTETALTGLQATLSRNDVPRLDEIVALSGE
jgi:hypothetical protein